MRRLHTEAICWLRFGKRMPIVCTEVGPWHADVLGVGDKMVIEVEIKKTRSDLRADFRNKKTKHWVYAHAEENPGRFVPNYLYYYVPESLRAYALEVVAAEAPKAGVAVQTETEYLDGRNVEIAKKPQRLRAGPPSQVMIRTAIQRMSSELAGRHVAYDTLATRMMESFKSIEEAAYASVIRSSGLLDSEDSGADLQQRAKELKLCVEGTDLFVSPEDEMKWTASAKKWLEAQYLNSKDWENAKIHL